MGKLLGLIIFTAALIWTWIISNSTSPVGFETHAALQHKLSQLILKAIAEKKPEAINAKIVKIQTETIDDNKIKAQFSYKFTEKEANGSPVDLILEGESFLSRSNKNHQNEEKNPNEANEETWKVEKVQIKNSSLLYSEGLIVTPHSKDEPAEVKSSESSPSEDKNSSESSSEDEK